MPGQPPCAAEPILSLSVDQDGFPAVCIWLDLCLDLTQAEFAEVSLPAVILPAEGLPNNTYVLCVFLVEKCEHIQAWTCEVNGNTEVSDSHLGILYHYPLTIVNIAL